MVKSFFVFFFLLNLNANALIGIQSLESRLLEQSPELSSLQQQVESQEALYSSGRSKYLPTLNAVAGWQQNKTDDLATTEKGAVGYLEASYNLFNGFKDGSLLNQKESTLNLAKIDLQIKQRNLRISLTEVLSEMTYLHQLQSILAEEYKTVQTQKQMADKKVAAGLTGPVDNLEFTLRESEVEIEQNQIEQLHAEAHQKLLKLFGAEVSDQEIDQIEFENQAELTSVKTEFAADKSLESQRSKQYLVRAQSEKLEARSDFLPKLDLTASVGRLTPSENTPMQYNESKYGITLTIPLFSGFDTYYKLKASKSSLLSAEKSLINSNNELNAEFKIIKNKILELDKLYKINDLKLQTSQKYFELTLGEYRRGIKNSPDLVNATERLYSAKKKKFEILKELEILKIRINTL